MSEAVAAAPSSIGTDNDDLGVLGAVVPVLSLLLRPRRRLVVVLLVAVALWSRLPRRRRDARAILEALLASDTPPDGGEPGPPAPPTALRCRT